MVMLMVVIMIMIIVIVIAFNSNGKGNLTDAGIPADNGNDSVSKNDNRSSICM